MPTETKDRFKLFGDVDRRHHKSDEMISSDMPAWSMRVHLEDLQESIDSKQRAIDQGLVAGADLIAHKQMMDKEQERIDKINHSKPKIEGKDMDDLSSAHKTISKKIGESMFRHTDLEKGLADPHEEARRMKQPCIEIKSEAEADLARSCGVKITNGKVSRDAAQRMFRVSASYLNENSNPETLRRA